MIRRLGRNLGMSTRDAPAETLELERDGYSVIRGVLGTEDVDALSAEIRTVFETTPADPRPRPDREEFRYEMFNRSAACQAALGHERILAVIEPLLGGDCHVIANTAWSNPPEFGGGPWHCDAGPHIPRPPDVPWDDRIPYPIFAIGAHLLLRDCLVIDGPTAVVPGSHRSGQLAPSDRLRDPDLSYDGRPPVLLEGRAGDVAMFVSDAWHRGTAAGPGGRGRFFLQIHYGRRDIAQRVRPTDQVNHVSPEAASRAGDERARALIGLHPPFFYDG